MESSDSGVAQQDPVPDLRERAIDAIRRKRKFRRDVVIYLLVNAFLWVVWAVDGARTDDLWPAWVSGIWGALLLFDAYRAFGEGPISDQQIESEMDRLRRR